MVLFVLFHSHLLPKNTAMTRIIGFMHYMLCLLLQQQGQHPDSAILVRMWHRSDCQPDLHSAMHRVPLIRTVRTSASYSTNDRFVPYQWLIHAVCSLPNIPLGVNLSLEKARIQATERNPVFYLTRQGTRNYPETCQSRRLAREKTRFLLGIYVSQETGHCQTTTSQLSTDP